jgi:hypothetical protein
MIDDFSKYDFFYVNGASAFEGGGLEESNIKYNSYEPLYKKKYNVSWKNKSEINFGKRLSQIINIPCINDAISGCGTDRLVRTTYDFIFKNWKNKDKFFIIIEPLDAARSDVFYNQINDYFIVNSGIQKDKLEFAYATREYYNKKYESFDNKNQKIFKEWFDRHFNLYEKTLNDNKDFLGLYSFCKLNDIKIYVMNLENISSVFSNVVFDCIDKNDIVKFKDSKETEQDDLYNWCKRNKLLIKDDFSEDENDYFDIHPGYFGHIEYSKKLAEFLGWKKTIDIFKNKIK